MMHIGQLLINGKWQFGSGKVFRSLNPAEQRSVWQGKAATVKDIDRAVKAAEAAFLGWSGSRLEERKKYLEKFAAVLEKQKEAFATLISEEVGKPKWESLTEVSAMISKIAISLRAYEERCPTVSVSLAESSRHTRFKPHGVVVVFGPFNLPGHLPNGHIVPALLAGNTVVFKPSELSPAVGEKLVELWQEAGLPSGVLNLVQGGRSAGVLLSRHKAINGLYFTGSYETGRSIHQFFAGQPEKILALEMGGNNPLIVFDAKDLETAAYLTIQSSFITSGQRCVCARRVIVQKGKEGDQFLSRLCELTDQIQIGPYTRNPEPFMGPVISVEAASRLLSQQARLKKLGGKVLRAMRTIKPYETFLAPGIMDVSQIKNRGDEEIFGPLIQVIRVKNFDAALEEANATRFGLAAGLISDDAKLYQRFFERVRAGIVNWNRPLTGASSEAPFGGVGLSGNLRPSAYFAADYCSYPVASIETADIKMPKPLTPGIADKEKI